MSVSPVFKTIITSPVGPLLVGMSQQGIVGLYFDGIHRRQPAHTQTWIADPSRFTRVTEQVNEYFSGTRNTFDLDLDLNGAPPFFQRVWCELRKIPYGQTISYAELADRLSPTVVNVKVTI